MINIFINLCNKTLIFFYNLVNLINIIYIIIVCIKKMIFLVLYYFNKYKNMNELQKIINQFLNKPWDWYFLSMNPNITWDIINNNLDKHWMIF